MQDSILHDLMPMYDVLENGENEELENRISEKIWEFAHDLQKTLNADLEDPDETDLFWYFADYADEIIRACGPSLTDSVYLGDDGTLFYHVNGFVTA